MTWNPDQYHQFKDARSAPARDLQALIPERPYAQVVDLGCGTGEQTAQLAQRFPQATVLGLDSSAAMLAKAGAQQLPNLRFEQGDIQELSGSFDLLYSNAALQWLPDHPDCWRGCGSTCGPVGCWRCRFQQITTTPHTGC